jgi:flagellar motor protein MotB
MNHQTDATIIVIKKKFGRGGVHQGGAWKVAYADFVTAMMALFIVLWLMNSSEQVKRAISAYFLRRHRRNRVGEQGQYGLAQGPTRSGGPKEVRSSRS